MTGESYPPRLRLQIPGCAISFALGAQCLTRRFMRQLGAYSLDGANRYALVPPAPDVIAAVSVWHAVSIIPNHDNQDAVDRLGALGYHVHEHRDEARDGQAVNGPRYQVGVAMSYAIVVGKVTVEEHTSLSAACAAARRLVGAIVVAVWTVTR